MPSHPDTTSIHHLPEPVLANILCHVQQRERLCCCALVSRAWAAAAAAATTAVSVYPRHPECVEGFNAWLQQHARQITDIKLGGGQGPEGLGPFVLPLAATMQLRTLDVSRGVKVQLLHPQAGAGSDEQLRTAEPGSVDADGTLLLLPALQGLTMMCCSFHEGGIRALRLPQLTCLSTGIPYNDAVAGESSLALSDAVVGLLRRLPFLSQLGLSDVHVGGEMAAIGPMQRLSSCWLIGDISLAPMLCAPHLESLELGNCDQHVFSPSMLPAPGWPRLVHLSVSYVDVHAAVLAHFPTLEHLDLADVRLLPAGVLASDDIDMFEAAAGTEDLMQALRHLTRLISLRLFCVELHAVDQQQVQQFSAITASSRLCSLKLSTERVQPLPKRAARHMFAAGRQLASLTQLHLNVWEGLDFEEDPLPGQHDPGRFWCLDTADIDRIAASCPALTVLQVQFAVRCSEAAMKSVVRLQQQLGLPELAIGGPNLRDDAGPILAQMTSLNVLRICHSPGFTHEGLRHLTALQQLTSLGFNICDCCGEAGPRWTESPKWFGAGASDQARPPDVWSKLRDWLNRYQQTGAPQGPVPREQPHTTQVDAL